MTKTILVVDDKAGVRDLVRDYLTAQGYRVVVAADGRQALVVARQEEPDLVLLDIMMPEMDGYAFMREHAKERDTPIILLTARVDETDKVLGLELGADDYITKPFGMRELTARIRAVLRRLEKSESTGAEPANEVVRAADIVLDKGRRDVRVGERDVRLTPTEFDLLAVMMAAPGRVFSREILLDQLHGVAFESLERSVDVHIRNLRRKIEPAPEAPRYVETVFGVGYRFRASDAPGRRRG